MPYALHWRSPAFAFVAARLRRLGGRRRDGFQRRLNRFGSIAGPRGGNLLYLHRAFAFALRRFFRADNLVGDWLFETSTFEGDCMIKGEMHFKKTQLSNTYSCTFESEQICGPKYFHTYIRVSQACTAQKVGMFTTDQCGPAEVAKGLLGRKIDYFTAYVCENLGARDERVTRGTLSEIATQKFDPLNVMILVRDPDAPDRPRDAVGRRLFGNPDEAFLQSQPKYGLLTPAEVRAIALAQLDIAPSSTVWDVGAGSGSVSIEAAQMASDGAVFQHTPAIFSTPDVGSESVLDDPGDHVKDVSRRDLPRNEDVDLCEYRVRLTGERREVHNGFCRPCGIANGSAYGGAIAAHHLKTSVHNELRRVDASGVEHASFVLGLPGCERGG